MSLTEDERSSYENQGFVSGIRVLSNDDAQSIVRLVDSLLADVNRNGEEVGFRLHDRHLDLDFMWRLVGNPIILSCVQALIGPDIMVLGTRLICKWRQDSGFVPWHQDLPYMMLNPPEQVTVYYAVDDNGIDNGCLMVIPESGEQRILEHQVANYDSNNLVDHEIPVNQNDLQTAVPLVLQSGEIAVFNGTIIHGSSPNCSDRRRASITIRYTTPRVRPLRSGQWPAVRVSGVDREKHFGDLTRESARNFRYH